MLEGIEIEGLVILVPPPPTFAEQLIDLLDEYAEWLLYSRQHYGSDRVEIHKDFRADVFLAAQFERLPIRVRYVAITERWSREKIVAAVAMPFNASEWATYFRTRIDHGPA